MHSMCLPHSFSVQESTSFFLLKQKSKYCIVHGNIHDREKVYLLFMNCIYR